MTDLVGRLDAAASAIAARTGRDAHDVAVVLGSGLGTFPDRCPDRTVVPYDDIPGFPLPAVAGHGGTLSSARFGDHDVLLFSGRTHAYEGHAMSAIVFAVRTAVRAGCRAVVLTNAAGGCGDGMAAGDLVLIRDHLNLTGRNPLVGPNDERLGPRFVDLTDTYDPDLRALAREVGDGVGVHLREGVYAWFLGPTYETPAEVRMARRLGADLVGMSTVPEAIAARHMGARVLGISLVTNLAAGISPTPLSHEEVAAAAAEASDRFGRLLEALIPRIP